MEKSILETWQDEDATQSESVTAASRLRAARQMGERDSYAQSEAGTWRPLSLEEARADVARLLGGAPTDAEAVAYRDGWLVEQSADRVTLTGGQTWERGEDGGWTLVGRES